MKAILESSQAVHPNVLYPLAAIKNVLDWSDGAFRQARRQELKVAYCGRTAFILVSDFIKYVQENSRDTK